MKEKNDYIRREILTKENERFRFEEIGFISGIDSVIECFCNTYTPDKVETDFFQFKQNFLKTFYTKYRFSSFVQSNQNSSGVITLSKRLIRMALKRLQMEYDKDSIDATLRSKENSVAFFMSTMLFAEFYPKLSKNKVVAITPYTLFESYRQFIGARFPIEFKTYFRQLQLDDKEFWDKTYFITKKQIQSVTKTVSSSFSNRMDIIDEVVSSTFLMLMDKITIENTDIDFKDALAFKSYIYRTGHYKMMELLRKNKKGDFIENVEYIDEVVCRDEDNNDEFANKRVNDFTDIDINNEFEIANAISIILCDNNHAWREQLIGDDGERVEIFMMKYADEMNYDEIISLKYGSVSNAERKRIYDTMRQNMVRVRTKLISNLKNIVSDGKL